MLLSALPIVWLSLSSVSLFMHAGPGLAVRVLGDVTEGNALEVLRQVDEVYIQTIRDYGLYDQIWQAFAVFLPIRWTRSASHCSSVATHHVHAWCQLQGTPLGVHSEQSVNMALIRFDKPLMRCCPSGGHTQQVILYLLPLIMYLPDAQLQGTPLDLHSERPINWFWSSWASLCCRSAHQVNTFWKPLIICMRAGQFPAM